LDVSATGEAGLDFDNIQDASGAHTLTNITVPVVTSTGTVTGNVNGSAASVTGAVGSVTGSVGSVTGAVGSVTGSVASVTGAVGSVTAGVSLGADALTATALAGSAVDEIVDQVWDEARSGHVAAGSFGQGVATVQGDVTGNVDGSVDSVTGAVGSVTGAVGSVTGAVASVTGSVASVTGAVGSVTGAVASVTAGVSLGTDALTATALATSAVDEIVDQVWDELTSGHSGAGSTGLALANATAPTAAVVADAVWDELIAGHLESGSTGEALNAAGGAGDPWVTSLPGAYSAGQAGKIVGDYVDAAISSRLAPTTGARTLDVSATGEAGLDFDNIQDASGAHTLTNITVPVVTSTGTVTGNVNGSAASVTGAVGSVTGSVGSVTGAVGSVTAGVSLGADALTATALAGSAVDEIVDQVWDEALSGHVVGGSAGAALGAVPSANDNADQVWEETLADHSGTGGSTAEALNAAGGGVSASAIADAVWEELIADHSGTSGSVAEALASVAGPTGSSAITINVKDETAANISGVVVSVYDAANTALQTVGTTDTNGDYDVSLDDATYTLRLVKAGVSFTANQSLVVSGSATHNFTGTNISTGTPVSPTGCLVFGNLEDVGINSAASVTVTARYITPQKVGSTVGVKTVVSTTTDVNGHFELELAQNATVDFDIADGTIDIRFVVPSSSTYDIANKVSTVTS
jgi:hypothetical protein